MSHISQKLTTIKIDKSGLLALHRDFASFGPRKSAIIVDFLIKPIEITSDDLLMGFDAVTSDASGSTDDERDSANEDPASQRSGEAKEVPRTINNT